MSKLEVFNKDLVLKAMKEKFGDVTRHQSDPAGWGEGYSFLVQGREYQMEVEERCLTFRTKKKRKIVSFGVSYVDRQVGDLDELVKELVEALQWDEEHFLKKKKEQQQSAGLPANLILEEALKRIKEFEKEAQFAWKAKSADESACLRWPTHVGMSAVKLADGHLEFVWEHSEARGCSSGIQVVAVPKFDDPAHQPEKIVTAVVAVARATVFLTGQMTALRNVLEGDAHRDCDLALKTLGTIKEGD
jgi:hypothetical protein